MKTNRLWDSYLTLAFSHRGLAGVGWERGRLARNAALARGDTLTLAFRHEGQG